MYAIRDKRTRESYMEIDKIKVGNFQFTFCIYLIFLNHKNQNWEKKNKNKSDVNDEVKCKTYKNNFENKQNI